MIEFPTPSPAVFNNRSEPEKLGSVIAGMEHRYSPDCKSFAGEIYESLELSFDPQSSRGRREACCFASLWMKVKIAGINASALEELRIRAIEEARKVARRKLRCGNVSAVWVHIFERLVAARCRGEAV